MSGRPVVIDTRRDVLEALERRELVPHPTSDSSGGPTIELRNSMARFSSDPKHAARRASVEAAIASLDVRGVVRVVRAMTRTELDRGALDVLAIAASVPVASLGEVLGIERPGELVADVDSIVSVIGRNHHADADTDHAARRVLDHFAGRPEGAVAWASVLYQTMDAKAALISTRVVAVATATTAVPAVPRTRRRASVDVEVGGHRFGAGDELSIELGAVGLPFGAGPHACPGRELAVAIADAVVAEIDTARVDLDDIEVDAVGRPTRLALTPPVVNGEGVVG
jgi:cytochrome P450